VDQSPDTSTPGRLAPGVNPGQNSAEYCKDRSAAKREMVEDAAWRGELAQRLQAYRTRRRKPTPNVAQSQFHFEEPRGKTRRQTSAAIAEPPASIVEDFSFTIAIGRPSKKHALDDSRMVIDVSLPSDAETPSQIQAPAEEAVSQPGLYPVASIDDRRLAALIDLGCLLFAYGGFLMLFGSLGGQFTLSKLSAAVYTATFAIVYLQYFALFTVFGGTTPGMMMRNLQVASFSGEPTTPRQMLLRSAGYLLSAGTFFLGFLWAMWDEDQLTWHDRLSRTYLTTTEAFVDMETSRVAHGR
jgi:uncharacterized RDD family membrane protein YckC